MKRIISFALLSGLLITAGAAEGARAAGAADSECAPVSVELNTKIKAAIEAERQKDRIPGVVYAVHDDRCLIAMDSVGSADAAGTKSLDASRSLFRQASVSKLFATVAVSRLIESKILDRDMSVLELTKAPFVRFLLQRETPARLAQWEKIKIHHLMSHQAGISKDVPGALVFYNTEALRDHAYPSMGDLFRGLTSVEFIYPPGQIPNGFKYSNLGINLLARIVEAYNPDRLSYADYVRKNVLEPLSMGNTYYDVPWSEYESMVNGYGTLRPDGQRPSVPKAMRVGSYDGSIGVASNAADMAKFGMDLLRLARLESTVLRDADVVRDLLTLKSPAGPTIAWASGPTWQTLPGETPKDPLWFGHTGTGSSERSIVIASPERDLGIVLHFNVNDANREKYAKLVLDLVESAREKPARQLPEFTRAIVENAREFLLASPAPQPVIPPRHENQEELRKFVGTYFADVVGEQKITLSDDGYLVFYNQKLVVVDAARGKFRFPTIAGAAGTLFNGEPIVFGFDKNGVPNRIRVALVKKFKRVGE